MTSGATRRMFVPRCRTVECGGRVRAFDRVLMARLSASAARDAQLGQRDVDEAVRRIIEAGGSLGITRLAPSLGVSRQHLARRFAQLVGVSPKVFARVVRLGRVDRARSRGGGGRADQLEHAGARARVLRPVASHGRVSRNDRRDSHGMGGERERGKRSRERGTGNRELRTARGSISPRQPRGVTS